jgi:hypothetical protein
MGASSRTNSGHRSARRSSSPPVRDAAREEGQRHGDDGRVTYLHGDFVDLADLVGPAEIVTLDRVIDVYPGWERLAGLAAGHAKRLFGLVYPRATRVVRLIIIAMNLMLGLQSRPVRAFIRSGDAIERIAGENGLTPHAAHDVDRAWTVAVFRRE